MITIMDKRRVTDPAIDGRRNVMSQVIERKQVCECKNCGNEAEMVVTCSLPDADPAPAGEAKAPAGTEKDPNESKSKVKGTAVCSHCGNEADMWIDI